MPIPYHQFVSERLVAFRLRGRMWGSPEALEALAIQLVETEIRHYAPEAYDESPRIIMDCYITEKGKLCPGASQLHSLAPAEDFSRLLFVIIHRVRYILGTKYKLWGPEGKAGYNLPEAPDVVHALQRSANPA